MNVINTLFDYEILEPINNISTNQYSCKPTMVYLYCLQ